MDNKQIIFKDEEHKGAFNKIIMDYMGKGKKVDCYVKPLFYLLTLSADTRRNFDSLFDIDKSCIKPDGVKGGWLTSSTKRLCQLSFNLFNGYTQDGRKKCSEEYSPYYMFANEWAPYFVQAIKLRYDSYFRTRL